MHAYGTKSINLAACSRAKVKVDPLARIRIADEVYITTLLAAAFGNISHAVEVAYGAERKDTHEEPNGARFGNVSHAAEVSYLPTSKTQRAPSCTAPWRMTCR